MSGTPCFTGTRVPIRTLFDHLVDDYRVSEMLQQVPTVNREQIEALLEHCYQKLMVEFPPKRPR
jgi:uncharacterized protein (DUF433 family)